MLTDSDVILRNLKPTPALMCVQRKAQKRVSVEEDFIRSNVESFGSDIGQTTNWITSMYEVRAAYDPESEEYKTLDYRIKCGQMFQQNAIDKAKGIVCKPMPKEWHDRHSAGRIVADQATKDLYRRIVAEKKPYFMRYIYPDLSKQYNTYIKNTNRNALREFQLSVDDLMQIDENDRTERQEEFIRYYDYHMPVGLNDCVMNKICRAFESEFDGFVGRANASSDYDYRIMRSSAEYTEKQYIAVERLYKEYSNRLSNYAVSADYERVDEGEAYLTFAIINEEFEKACAIVCPNEDALCNILLDMCYKRKSTKRFVWHMCGSVIIRNLLRQNNNLILFPTLDEDGELIYCGKHFRIDEYRMVDEDDDYTE